MKIISYLNLIIKFGPIKFQRTFYYNLQIYLLLSSMLDPKATLSPKGAFLTSQLNSGVQSPTGEPRLPLNINSPKHQDSYRSKLDFDMQSKIGLR